MLAIVSTIFLSGCFLIGNVKETGRQNWHDRSQEQIRALPIQEVIDQLRRDYSTFECPQKSDRMHIPEDVWQQIDWTEEERYRNAALPHKMWNMRHDDHQWPSCKKWRGDDAFGPRAGEGHDKYFSELPQLVKGQGIARWMAAGDVSVIEIPLFKDYEVTWTTSTIPATLDIVERNCVRPDYGQTRTITKEYLLATYAPSPIQKFSEKSWLETSPKHVSYHTTLDKREDYCSKPEGPDKVYFWRSGWRWDSIDRYFVKGAFYVGGHWN